MSRPTHVLITDEIGVQRYVAKFDALWDKLTKQQVRLSDIIDTETIEVMNDAGTHLIGERRTVQVQSYRVYKPHTIK